MEKKSAYAAAGVDIEAANRSTRTIKELVRTTFGPEVVGGPGGFGGMFAPPWKEYRDPVLVSSIDGVGTKLRLAFVSGRHDTVGIDIVHHCANDILVQGARPLFFMDYLAMGVHDPDVVEAIVRGVATGCRNVGCALIGGETAEMPDFYRPGEYDLAGSIVGIVDREGIIDGRSVTCGDAIIGLASDGLHTNGYSLARRIVFTMAELEPDDPLGATGHTVTEELLRPHRSYVQSVLALLQTVSIKGIAHITGGGVWDNLPRVVPAGLCARIRRGTWSIPPVFDFLQETGKIDEHEMFHVFNMGLGLVLFVDPADSEAALEGLRAHGEDARLIGEVEPDEGQSVVLE